MNGIQAVCPVNPAGVGGENGFPVTGIVIRVRELRAAVLCHLHSLCRGFSFLHQPHVVVAGKDGVTAVCCPREHHGCTVGSTPRLAFAGRKGHFPTFPRLRVKIEMLASRNNVPARPVLIKVNTDRQVFWVISHTSRGRQGGCHLFIVKKKLLFLLAGVDQKIVLSLRGFVAIPEQVGFSDKMRLYAFGKDCIPHIAGRKTFCCTVICMLCLHLQAQHG